MHYLMEFAICFMNYMRKMLSYPQLQRKIFLDEYLTNQVTNHQIALKSRLETRKLKEQQQKR